MNFTAVVEKFSDDAVAPTTKRTTLKVSNNVKELTECTLFVLQYTLRSTPGRRLYPLNVRSLTTRTTL